ncbi:hypothetical protein TB2_011740 [Malus domestica]
MGAVVIANIYVSVKAHFAIALPDNLILIGSLGSKKAYELEVGDMGSNSYQRVKSSNLSMIWPVKNASSATSSVVDWVSTLAVEPQFVYSWGSIISFHHPLFGKLWDLSPAGESLVVEGEAVGILSQAFPTLFAPSTILVCLVCWAPVRLVNN